MLIFKGLLFCYIRENGIHPRHLHSVRNATCDKRLQTYGLQVCDLCIFSTERCIPDGMQIADCHCVSLKSVG